METKVWSHLLKKSLMENLVFSYSDCSTRTKTVQSHLHMKFNGTVKLPNKKQELKLFKIIFDFSGIN